MSEQYEKPTIEKTPDNPTSESVERHPAYAQIGSSRVSGRAFLYGSDFDHQHYMTIRISRSELHRDLSRDWAFATEEIIEVALSEAQWAAFVSTSNMGQGVQCTIQHLNRERVSQIPEATKRKDQFAKELKERLSIAEKELSDLRAMIESSKFTEKAKKELLGKLSGVERNLTPNIKFVAEQFGEHMEGQIEHAKIEVSAYITSAIMRTGIEALKAQNPPIQIKASVPAQGQPEESSKKTIDSQPAQA
jgi:DNA repair exonuclease SbcCD ATPase subunit